MPTDPITGQLISAGAYGVEQTPIGQTALTQRPEAFKAFDAVMHGGSLWYAVHMRSHSRLITGGPARGVSKLRDRFERSYALAGDTNTKAGRAIYEDLYRAVSSKVDPRTWWKAPSYQAFNPMVKGKEFGSIEGILKKLPDSWREKSGLFKDKQLQHLLDPNFVARISAASTWDKMATREEGRLGALMPHEELEGRMTGYLNRANPELLGRLEEKGLLKDLTYRDAATLTRMASGQVITGRIGGFIEGFAGSSAESPIMDVAMRDATGELTRAGSGFVRGAALRGSLEATAADEGANVLARVGSRIALRAGAFLAAGGPLDPIADILAAIGIAQLSYQIGSAVVGGVVHMGEKAVNSFMGSINKPMFGMGYHDTVAASTSRQRGVMAIARSQLNARSVLGNEAGALFQHFG